MTGEIASVLVVIPARNEQALLPRCLTALSTAIDCVHTALGEAAPRVSVLVVLDRCTDDSAMVVSEWPAFRAMSLDAGSVGVARAAGIRLLMNEHTSSATWIATTDADSAVPPSWLTTQLALARNGAELVLGTVWPDLELSQVERERWASAHTLVEGHPHIHGANLGVRADRYLEAGGFAAVETDEDLLLVESLRALGVREAKTALIPVLTSGRLVARSPAGFSGYLREQIASRS